MIPNCQNSDPYWSASPNFGSAAGPVDLLRAGFFAGQRVSFLRVPDKASPGPLSVSLSIEGMGVGDMPIDSLYPIYGVVKFGAGGDQQVLEVDWAQGTTFTLPASVLELYATLKAAPGFALPMTALPKLTLRAQAAFGPLACCGASYTVFGEVLDSPNDTFVAPIPSHARELVLMGRGDNLFNAANSVSFLSASNVFLATWLANDATLRTGVPVPNGARFARYDAATPTATPRFYFNLKV